MHGLLPLQPFIGLEKTLVIICHECLQPEAHDEQVFIYQCLGNMLRKDDQLQHECIRYYLDVKQCSQIILVGHYDCHVIQKILAESEIHTPQMALRYNLKKILSVYAYSLLKPGMKDRTLIELKYN
jgi:carbonic anhydrase